jgi:hypothetical protein
MYGYTYHLSPTLDTGAHLVAFPEDYFTRVLRPLAP